jgi:tRNA pseudouridine38-40 synthase
VGLQFQRDLRSVQSVLETALSRIFEEPIKLAAAGRTDAGVHASGQVVSFTTARSSFPFERLAIALNSALPSDVSVRDAAVVPYEFSARFSAVERSYVYAIFNRREPSALLATSAYHVYATLDLDAFGDAAAALIGKHDFRSFCGTPPDNDNTVRTVKSLTIRRRGDLIRIGISADGFVHRMVRTIVGTLLECATGRRDPGTMPEILHARMRSAAGLTAPAHGLYLAGVLYRDGYDSYSEPPLFS